MGREEVKEAKTSRFSLFRHRVAGLFKDIVEVPPEEIKPVEIVEPEVNEEIARLEISEDADEPEEFDDEKAREEEREKTREKIHEHIMSSLNEAVSHWKETGDVGIHLEPPVPLKDRVKLVWERMGPAGSAISARLKVCFGEVMEKVNSRLKSAEVHGEKVDENAVIEEEWSKVLKKIESISSSDERAEIEKIYKELVGNK